MISKRVIISPSIKNVSNEDQNGDVFHTVAITKNGIRGIPELKAVKPIVPITLRQKRSRRFPFGI